MKTFIGILIMIVGFEVSASGFFPKNSQKIPLRPYFSLSQGITEQQFAEIPETIQRLYVDVVKSQGGNLVVKLDWNEENVNAFAERVGKNWNITLFGGLARHPNMTVDSFALIVCHELGHHMGGAVKNPFLNRWSTSEGSSDYFAATKCFKKYAEIMPLENYDENLLEEYALNACRKMYSDSKEREICVRIGLAAKSAIQTLDTEAADRIKFSTPDKSVVKSTRVTHPDSQCRLDTFLAGALCTADKDAPLDDEDYHVGTCTALTHTEGLRPRCWFKPEE